MPEQAGNCRLDLPERRRKSKKTIDRTSSFEEGLEKAKNNH